MSTNHVAATSSSSAQPVAQGPQARPRSNGGFVANCVAAVRDLLDGTLVCYAVTYLKQCASYWWASLDDDFHESPKRVFALDEAGRVGWLFTHCEAITDEWEGNLSASRRKVFRSLEADGNLWGECASADIRNEVLRSVYFSVVDARDEQARGTERALHAAASRLG